MNVITFTEMIEWVAGSFATGVFVGFWFCVYLYETNRAKKAEEKS